jgi:integrase/recombinase XerC
MTAASVSGRDAELDAARLLLSRLGVSPEELLQSPMVRPVVPTFREYLPVVRAAVGVGTLRAYSSYWNRIEQQRGERLLPTRNSPSSTQLRRPAATTRLRHQ